MANRRRTLQMIILIVIVIVGAWTIFSSLFTNHSAPVIGDKAPNFKLLGLDGKSHQLSDYKGKTVIVNFWGTYCTYCKQEMPAIQLEYEKWKKAGIVVLGVNMGESAITAQSYVDNEKVSFPILLDEDFSIREMYGVINYPTTFFIKPNGVIAQINVGGMDQNYIQQAIVKLLGQQKI